jgi:hypothetical protein
MTCELVSCRQRLAASMRHLEAVIRMLTPGIDIRRTAIKRCNRQYDWFKRGTLFRLSWVAQRSQGAADGELFLGLAAVRRNHATH